MRANLKWTLLTRLLGTCLIVGIAIGITSCQQSVQTGSELAAIASSPALATTDGPLSEVNIPITISKLAPSLEKFQPQVRILSPKPGETLADDRVDVKLQVTDLPLFKQPELGLGNHLHVILDEQTYQGVYDLSQPLVFKNLAAGTHSLRVFASRPWHESFKNAGAYAQVSFNVLTSTAENNPNPQQPLLTYSRPAGTYSVEPIMLDYYLTNVPTDLGANDSPDPRSNWRIRVTVNEQRFILDRWEPIYLQGFKQGKNWVRLELLDDRGNPIPNVYNDTIGIVTYDPQFKDPLTRLIRSDIDPDLARALVDPNYIAIKPAPLPTPTPPLVPTPPSAPVPLPIPLPLTPAIPDPAVVAPPPIVRSNPIETARLPVTTPSPNPDAATPPQPAPAPIVQPMVPPLPIAPVIIAPVPIAPPPVAVIKPNPVTEKPILIKPIPAEVPSPNIITNPISPSPVPPPQLAPIATPPPTVKANPPVYLTPLSPQVSIPTVTAPSGENQDKTTWQTQVIDLLNVARAKIRVFTNTIPARANRFGDHVRVWAGNAKNYTSDRLQEWRNRG